MITVLIILAIFSLAVAFLFHPLFGKHPSGARAKRIAQSPNFKNKQFQNLIPTPQLTDGYTMPQVLMEFMFGKKIATKPATAISVKPIDFKKFDLTQDGYFWLGHSSYLIVLEGKVFLIDPVLTPNAAPVLHSNDAFKGTTFIDMQQLPIIDYLIITHDHYDHLDYTTIRTIRPKVKNVICGLGVGSHFEHWKYDPQLITELDWWEMKQLDAATKITATPARHFSGRTFFHKNDTLFCSYVLEVNHKKIFIGGDSGYGPHFKEIGERFAPFDIAFLENGQYNKAWHYIHLHPEELPLVVEDLKLNRIVPVHHSKFALSTHPWKKPLEDASSLASATLEVQTPLIGEFVNFNAPVKQWQHWWEDIN